MLFFRRFKILCHLKCWREMNFYQPEPKLELWKIIQDM